MTGRHRATSLTGGNASASVVRIGDTVRKPWLPTTDLTVAYMQALRNRGVDLPEPRARDELGRLVLEYVPGDLAMDRGPLDVALLRRVGALVRTIHDASAGLPVPDPWEVLLPVDRPNLLCHNDLAAWNLVIDGDRLVFIDWDGAGPSTRLWDLAYAAISFGHVFAGEDVGLAASRLVAFVDGYDADEQLRAALPSTMARRARAMHDLLHASHEAGREPWGSMYATGHGEHWQACAAFIARHEHAWLDAVLRAVTDWRTSRGQHRRCQHPDDAAHDGPPHRPTAPQRGHEGWSDHHRRTRG
ncbi:phosphotransferase [Tetrasphaera sp. HKS02]|uniref:phosphotransferase n=1 Tax=Nostocoides sp. HKS02 TaxID=1813880 RepID=UPI0012B44457|nr:phosphotransferase [Tetrasphaera sp. HKS02]